MGQASGGERLPATVEAALACVAYKRPPVSVLKVLRRNADTQQKCEHSRAHERPHRRSCLTGCWSRQRRPTHGTPLQSRLQLLPPGLPRPGCRRRAGRLPPPVFTRARLTSEDGEGTAVRGATPFSRSASPVTLSSLDVGGAPGAAGGRGRGWGADNRLLGLGGGGQCGAASLQAPGGGAPSPSQAVEAAAGQPTHYATADFVLLNANAYSSEGPAQTGVTRIVRRSSAMGSRRGRRTSAAPGG